MKDMSWFKFRGSWVALFHKMNKKESDLLLDCIDAYLSETEVPELPEKLEFAWLLIEQDLAEDLGRVKNAREAHREAGKKGGRPRKTSETTEESPLSASESKRSRIRIREEKEEEQEEQDKDSEEEKKLERDQDNPPLCPPKGDKGRFDQFWAAYPRKASKAAARKAFEKLKVTDEKLMVLLDALARQRRSDQWTRENGRYIPYASTWLNGARWEDAEPEISRPMNPFLEMLYAERGETV